MQKFEFLRQPLLGELAMSRKKERREWPPTFMPAAKGSARTPLGPIKVLMRIKDIFPNPTPSPLFLQYGR